jgi:hypothetical protein
LRAPAVLLAATVLFGIVAASGCGFGAGESEQGEANLRVTREFGAEQMVDATLTDPTESDTVVRFLDEEADIETSYGGNFVDSINGVAGSTVNGGAEDWFFFVNGYYSDIGAGEAKVHAGDRIWWDYRDWAQAYRVPAVVGSYPEPFLHGHDGEQLDVVLECVARSSGCETAAAALDDAGIDFTRDDVAAPEAHPDELRVLVGAWSDVRNDQAASELDGSPSDSGVYATMGECGSGYELAVLGSDGKPRLQLSDAGLVAALRHNEDQPTWVVTGTTHGAVDRAAALIGEDTLRDRYAVAAGPSGEAVSVPAPDDVATAEDSSCG